MPVGAVVPLVGRQEELGFLSQRLRAVAEGGTGACTLFVEGPAGIGKTRLVTEALAGLEDEGIQLRWGAAEELARTRPFWPLAEALGCRPAATDPQLRAVGALLVDERGGQVEPLERAAHPQQRFAVLEALLTVIEELTARGPLVIVLDDLQWADPATLLALRVMARRLRSQTLAVVATCRPEPHSPDLQQAIAGLVAEGADTLRLAPLREDAVAELVGGLVAAAPGPTLLHELAGAGGSPLFVIELVRGLLDEGAVELTGGAAVVTRPPLPASFRLTVNRRLDSLSTPVLRVLRVAAVLGTTFSVADLAAALGQPAVALLDPLDECFRAGLLTDEGDRLAFTHHLVREAIYQELAPALRRQLHLEIGRSLAAADGGADQVAYHLGRGATKGDADAVRWLHRAARSAAPSAPTAAVELLETARELAGDPAQRDGLAPDLAQALIWAGRPRDAEALARRTLATTRGEAALRLHLVLASALLVTGRVTESADAIREVMAESDPTGHEWASLRAEAALGRLLSGDLAGAAHEAAEALALGEAHRATVATSVALATQGWIAHATGRLDEAIDLTRAAVAAVGERESGRHSPHFFLGIVLCSADRLDEAEEVFQRARHLSEQTGSRVSTAVHHCGLALRRFHAGEWDDAQAEAEAGLALAEERGTGLVVFFLQSMVALLHHHHGDDVAAERAVTAAEAHAERSGPQFGLDWLIWARALVSEQADSSRALVALSNGWGLYSALGLVTHCQTIGPDLVRLSLSAGETDRARAVTDEVEAVAQRTGAASDRGAALRCRGLLEADPELLTMSSAAYERAGRPFETARAAEDAAVAFLAHGRADRARPLASAALDTYERLGATMALSRTTAALRPLALRGRRRPRPRPTSGWASLTPTELRVVELAATGLTNRAIGERLYVSRRTVETHLAHVFTKLDLSSRTELAAEATRRQLATSS